jgi:2-isopropylmalate synthase
VGIRHSTLVLGKHSGRHALKQRYAELGYHPSTDELERVYKAFCLLADQKKEIVDDDLIAILGDDVESGEEAYQLEHIQFTSGTNLRPTATVQLKSRESQLIDSATGDGPVDAAYKAIERITGVVGTLTEYSIKSVSAGHDAIGEVFVRVTFDGVQYNGRAVSTDVVTGSVKAYLEALNRAVASRERKAREQKESRKQTMAW